MFYLSSSVSDKSVPQEKQNMESHISDDGPFLDKMEWIRYEARFNYKMS